MKQLLSEIKSDAMSVNKYLTTEYINKLSVEQILCFTSPLYRDRYKRQLELI